jgi:UDPglucose 6-dehydrogenase
MPTIYEDGLQDLLESGLRSGRLRFTSDNAKTVADADFVFLCLPAPGQPDGSTDLSAFEDVCRAVGPHLRAGAVIVNKSTLPIGSTEVIGRALGRDDVAVVSCPEFLREGTAIADTLHPSRIVVGATDDRAANRVVELLVDVDAPVLVTTPSAAEMIKYASNAFLATKLSFVNDMAGLCEALGADVDDVLRGVGLDPRIGSEYLRPGPGWGGSCLPKDAQAVVSMAREVGTAFPLVEEALRSNDRQIDLVVAKTRAAVGGELAGSILGVWGLTFKAGTDDRRRSAALEVVRRLAAARASITAYDPTTGGDTVSELPAVRLEREPYAAAAGAHALLVLTEWGEFSRPDFERLRIVMAQPAIVDARNLLDPRTARAAGFSYVGIGRP